MLALNDLNVSEFARQGEEALTVNSMFVADDEKQRQKLAESFYASVRKEISLYMERINHLLQSGCERQVITQRWVKKVADLQGKKAVYESALHRNLEDADNNYEALGYLVQELKGKIFCKCNKKQPVSRTSCFFCAKYRATNFNYLLRILFLHDIMHLGLLSHFAFNLSVITTHAAICARSVI